MHPTDSVDAILALDPANVYEDTDALTRSRYRARIDRLAIRAGVAPEVVAGCVLQAAHQATRDRGDSARSHVGYYLIDDDGARHVEDELGIHRTFGQRLAREAGRRARLVYVLAVVAGVVGVDLAYLTMQRVHLPSLLGFVIIIAGIPVATYYVSSLVQRAMLAMWPPRHLPRLTANRALASDSRVLIAIPTVFQNPEQVSDVIQRLATLSLTLHEPAFRFALLSDFMDAGQATVVGDVQLLDTAQRLVARLNADHGDDTGDKFFVLHRRRSWSEGERAWIGWERKRGKLLELFRLLLDRSEPTTIGWTFGDLAGLLARFTIPYAIVIDEHSWLDHASTWSLVCAAAHPLNRPVLDAASGQVIAGYGIVQPALTSTPAHSRSTTDAPAQRQGGYGSAIRRFFPFDALAVGVHKGAAALFDVIACHRLLDDTHPADAVLQHDVLDGFIARTGESHDAYVLQPRSRSYRTRLRRRHRWLRGTFQLLPWLRARVRNARNEVTANRLQLIQRYCIGELVVLELQRPASLALILCAWLAASDWVALCVVLVYPPLAGILPAAIRVVRHRGATGRTARVRAARVGGALAEQAFAVAFSFVVLAIETHVVIDAMARSTWRMVVSRSKLLEWTPHLAAEAGSSFTHGAYWRVFWPSAAMGTVFLMLAVSRSQTNAWMMSLFIAWVLAPSIVWLVDRHFLGAQ